MKTQISIEEPHLFDINKDVWLTEYTSIALFGKNFTIKLKHNGLLKEPDNSVQAFKISEFLPNNIRLWNEQSNYIPYIIQSSEINDIVEYSLNELSRLTNLKFKIRNNERNYIIFVNSGNCGGLSYIGMIGGNQDIKIPSITNCFNSRRIASGVTQHEILHAMGFSHEHSYPIRDNYVRILEENIQTNAIFNFKIRNINKLDSFNLPYDYKSIMHYKSKTFSKNNQFTITKLDGSIPDGDFGNSILSNIDIQKINLLYPLQTTTLPTPIPTLFPRPTPRPTQFLIPTLRPTQFPRPTRSPTQFLIPTFFPIFRPSFFPIPRPTPIPTLRPTFFPTARPIVSPSIFPSTNKNICFTKRIKCIFPFKFRSNIYYSCTTDFDPDNQLWCSTKVSTNGVHIRGYWGYCNNLCT